MATRTGSARPSRMAQAKPAASSTAEDSRSGALPGSSASAAASSSSDASKAGPPADLLSFPPFYTLQPVQATREKQLELWRGVVLKSLSSTPRAVIDMASFPLFKNQAIDRSLSAEGRRAVGQAIVDAGFGVWEDPADKTRLQVSSRTPEAWGALIYAWAYEGGRIGDEFYTLHEIYAGDEASAEVREGLTAESCFAACRTLESQGKAQILQASALDETGIKFL